MSVRDTRVMAINTLDSAGGLAGAVVLLGEGGILATGLCDALRVPIAATATLRRTRAICFGHEGFVGSGLAHPTNRALLEKWATPGKWATIGLSSPGATRLAPDRLRANDLARVSTLIVEQAALDVSDGTSRLAAQAIVEGWMDGASERTLIVAGPVWGWLQLHPHARFPEDHSGNRLLARFGLALAETVVSGPYAVTTDVPSEFGLAGALHTLERASSSGRGLRLATTAEATSTAEATIERALPVLALHPEHNATVRGARLTERLRARMAAERYDRCAPEDVGEHPSAAFFPGQIRVGAQTCERRLRVELTRHGWTSTGLYARPGVPVHLRVLNGDASGCALRIGAHADTLWHAREWRRFPQITVERAIQGPDTTAASAFGGPVFVTVAPGSTGFVEVSMSGAVAAPLFTLDTPNDGAWNDEDLAPAPWAELVGNLCALSVPSSAIRRLKQPDELIRYWDEVVASAHDLYQEPVRPRGQRFCVDVQISAGYMHAGYPIMTHDDVANRIVDLRVLRGHDGNETWGFFHEIGHNFQRASWTWDGTGEVTNNLFSMFANERFNDTWDSERQEQRRSHEQIRQATHERRVLEHRAAGASYESWKSDPWTGLSTFLELRRHFGWEPFQDVFASYYDSSGQNPTDDQAKRDEFVARFSTSVGRDVSHHFAADGVPLSDQLRRRLANLEPWFAPGTQSSPSQRSAGTGPGRRRWLSGR